MSSRKTGSSVKKPPVLTGAIPKLTKNPKLATKVTRREDSILIFARRFMTVSKVSVVSGQTD